jgi:AcrR family transcriptional regulator
MTRMARMPVEERRQQLVDAAIRVMTRDGVTSATTRAISSEAGLSLSVFHYCFNSKQDLLEAVIQTIVSHTVTPAKASIEPGANLEATIRGALGAYWTHVQANPEEHLLTYEVTQYCLRQPDFVHVARAQYEHYSAAYVEVFEQMHDLLGVESAWPLPVLANYLSSVIDGLTLNWLAQRDGAHAEEVLDAIAEHVASLLQGTGN